MSKGKKRRQKGEYTRPQHQPPVRGPVLPPQKAERARQVFVIFLMVSGWYWLCEVEDPDDVPFLLGRLDWLRTLSWPDSDEEFWTGPPLLERRQEAALEQSLDR